MLIQSRLRPLCRNAALKAVHALPRTASSPTQAIAYAEGVPLNWKSGELAEGLRCYRSEEFWLAHEHWEGVWLHLDEPEKSFLQALIQTTAALHHLQKGNTVGAKSLLRRALRRIEMSPAAFGGIDAAWLRDAVRAWLHALETVDAPRPAAFPEIRPLV
jgi:uncharacterized protein